jgi:hypothetical protein
MARYRLAEYKEELGKVVWSIEREKMIFGFFKKKPSWVPTFEVDLSAPVELTNLSTTVHIPRIDALDKENELSLINDRSRALRKWERFLAMKRQNYQVPSIIAEEML